MMSNSPKLLKNVEIDTPFALPQVEGSRFDESPQVAEPEYTEETILEETAFANFRKQHPTFENNSIPEKQKPSFMVIKPICLGYKEEAFEWNKFEAQMTWVFKHNLNFIIYTYPKDATALETWLKEFEQRKAINPYSILHKITPEKIQDIKLWRQTSTWLTAQQDYTQLREGTKKELIEELLNKYITHFAGQHPNIPFETIRPHVINEVIDVISWHQKKQSLKRPTHVNLLFYDPSKSEPMHNAMKNAENMQYFKNSFVKITGTNHYSNHIRNNHITERSPAKYASQEDNNNVISTTDQGPEFILQTPHTPATENFLNKDGSVEQTVNLEENSTYDNNCERLAMGQGEKMTQHTFTTSEDIEENEHIRDEYTEPELNQKDMALALGLFLKDVSARLHKKPEDMAVLPELVLRVYCAATKPAITNSYNKSSEENGLNIKKSSRTNSPNSSPPKEHFSPVIDKGSMVQQQPVLFRSSQHMMLQTLGHSPITSSQENNAASRPLQTIRNDTTMVAVPPSQPASPKMFSQRRVGDPTSSEKKNSPQHSSQAAVVEDTRIKVKA